MILLPAIDLYNGCAVRLVKGDYEQMTVYSRTPGDVARAFADSGAEYIHIVDLEGARDGTTANFPVVGEIVSRSGLRAQVGGGIRSRDVVEKYLDAGVSRVILGTAAVTRPDFVAEMVDAFGEHIAVGVDIRDGYAAIKGWTETSSLEGVDFCRRMEGLGVKTVICTDISRDGLLQGANLELYRRLAAELSINVIASGGVSSAGEIATLSDLGLYGAILGKALYEGRLSLREALEHARPKGRA